MFERSIHRLMEGLLFERSMNRLLEGLLFERSINRLMEGLWLERSININIRDLPSSRDTAGDAETTAGTCGGCGDYCGTLWRVQRPLRDTAEGAKTTAGETTAE